MLFYYYYCRSKIIDLMTRVLCSSQQRGNGYSTSGCSSTLALIIAIQNCYSKSLRVSDPVSAGQVSQPVLQSLPLFCLSSDQRYSILKVWFKSWDIAKDLQSFFLTQRWNSKLSLKLSVLNSTGHKHWELPHFCLSSRGCFAIWCILWWCLALLGLRVVRYYARCSWALDFF